VPVRRATTSGGAHGPPAGIRGLQADTVRADDIGREKGTETGRRLNSSTTKQPSHTYPFIQLAYDCTAPCLSVLYPWDTRKTSVTGSEASSSAIFSSISVLNCTL